MITAKEARKIMTNVREARIAKVKREIRDSIEHMALSGHDRTSIVLPSHEDDCAVVVSWLKEWGYRLKGTEGVVKISW